MKKIVWVVILSLGTIACNDSRAVELPGKELPTDSIKSGRVAGSVEVKGNMIIKSINEAGFYNYEKMDLRTNNPEILKKIPELNEFFPKIGLYRDKFRKKVVTREEAGGLTDRIGTGLDTEDKEIFTK
ncbi:MULTISPECIES: hypothetical protein [Bacteroides]|jgi:lipoprotein|uniref:hypothetical protein n=1 Tax=Bacteroides TaxID=816 RepID=UPI001F1C63A2|nr:MULTISPECIES: hypothetical protein [Bacteroides]MCE8922609.1 hypothetical protein [Bacteroides ovatus]